MKKFILLLLVIFIATAIFLFYQRNIYPFFQKIVNKYFITKVDKVYQENKLVENNEIITDIEDLIYIPPVKNIKFILSQKLVKDRYIKVVIPENVLYFYVFDPKENNFLLHSKYPVSTGKPKTPTEIGEGIIYTKGKILFKYLYGTNQNKIIEYSKMPDGTKIRIPYEKMFGLYMIINNSDRYVIHSTTEDYNIGKNISMGCVRMLIDDMLKLYPHIKTPMRITIEYNLFKLDSEFLTIYPDVYNRSQNLVNELLNFLLQNNINPLIFDYQKIKKVLNDEKPITISLNELLDDYFIAKNLKYNQIKITDFKFENKSLNSFFVEKLHLFNE